MPFRFTDRWQSSLASLFKDRDDKLALLELRDQQLESWLDLLGKWKPYTLTLTASGTDPNIGTTGTMVGRCVRAGDLVIAQGEIAVAGTGISAGTGSYEFGLPYPASSSITAPIAVGNLRVYDASVPHSGQFAGAYVEGGNQFVRFLYSATYPLGTDTFVGAASPFVPATGDFYQFAVAYEAAP